MARDNLTNTGVSDATITLALGAAAITAGTNAEVVIINDTDSTVRGTVTVPAGVTLGGNAADADYTFNIQAKSYEVLSVVKTVTTAASLTIASGGIETAHGTSAQVGEFVYLARIDN